MLHSAARSAIVGILQSDLFDSRAVCLSQAAELCASPHMPKALAEDALERALGLSAEIWDRQAVEYLAEDLPDDPIVLSEQLSRRLIDHPHEVSSHLDRLHCVVSLWPHASRDERYRLRRAWFTAMVITAAPEEAVLPRERLRLWQRNLPTQQEHAAPRLSDLQGILGQPDPEHAYQTLAAYLGSGSDLKRLGWVLGALAQQVLLHHFDRRGLCLRAVLGTVAWSCLAPHMNPETSVTLLSQLSHEIWWISHHAGLTAIRPGATHFQRDLMGAVHDNDYTAAQRAARQLACQGEAFWHEVARLFEEFLRQGNRHWPRGLAAISASLCRANGHPVSPDDAASLAAALVAVHYLATGQGSGVFHR